MDCQRLWTAVTAMRIVAPKIIIVMSMLYLAAKPVSFTR
jgi:hypothetical protein